MTRSEFRGKKNLQCLYTCIHYMLLNVLTTNVNSFLHLKMRSSTSFIKMASPCINTQIT